MWNFEASNIILTIHPSIRINTCTGKYTSLLCHHSQHKYVHVIKIIYRFIVGRCKTIVIYNGFTPWQYYEMRSDNHAVNGCMYMCIYVHIQNDNYVY